MIRHIRERERSEAATAIHAALARRRNPADWPGGTFGLCVALANARTLFTANIPFGHWCDAQGFGLSHQDRAAAIAMGKEPERARVVLMATARRSLRHIYANEFHLTHAGKTPKGAMRAEKTPVGKTPKPPVMAEDVQVSRAEPAEALADAEGVVRTGEVAEAVKMAKAALPASETFWSTVFQQLAKTVREAHLAAPSPPSRPIPATPLLAGKQSGIAYTSVNTPAP